MESKNKFKTGDFIFLIFLVFLVIVFLSIVLQRQRPQIKRPPSPAQLKIIQDIKEENDYRATLTTSTITETISTIAEYIAEECKREVNDDYIKEHVAKLQNNRKAIEIIKENCLRVMETTHMADFDGDNQDELALITSGFMCGSCHGQKIFIIKNYKIIFYDEGDDFSIWPAENFVGFVLKQPVRKEGEGMCCPSEGIYRSYKVKKNNTGLETFYQFAEEQKPY